MCTGKNHTCQIYSVPEITEPPMPLDFLRYVQRRLKRFLKRRYWYLVNRCSNSMEAGVPVQGEACRSRQLTMLKSGDLVRVRSMQEIRGTLDNWNKLKGCSFMEEMHQYCGTIQRVHKRVETFLDERDYRAKRCKGIYLLEGVMCQGTVDFGPCDRSCFFFWREEWLEKR